MKDISKFKRRLVAYLQKQHGWVSKGQICDIAREATGATGEHTGRRLRELENDGLVEVQHRKNHSWYKAKDRPVQQVIIKDGKAYMQQTLV